MQNNNSTASTASSLADPSAFLTLETFRRVPLSVAASGPDAAAALLSAPCRELLRLGAARGARTALWVCAAPDCSLAAAAVLLARKLEEIFAGDAALAGVPRVLVTDFSPALLEEAGVFLAEHADTLLALLICGAPRAAAADGVLSCEPLLLRRPVAGEAALVAPVAACPDRAPALSGKMGALGGNAGQEAAPDELALDGVRYVDLRQNGLKWRLAGVNPLWRQDLVGLGASPDAAAVSALEARGLWLAPAVAAPPLAVMCCGLGSVWPGMGRELYDSFPAARAAMERIAAVADWDVLALMDETDVEKISLTRWQVPYLFLLEYAQWSQFVSLGLAPALMCGHSLGELIALCFAGIYEPEVAWYILDTRAAHMAELEAKATRETGMMAVHADADVIEEARKTWPALYVSNYNTPRQFILSGPREVLLEARKSMRKRRIPAIMLNVSLAFHHPSMRVLRDLSLRRLNALEMRAPRLPMLSDITTGFYPQDQPSICRYITDLDENSVRWVEGVRAMWERDGIRHFLELGPQDTLCGLVGDIEPRALCLSAGRKGRETEGLRQACARLYALGHLPRAAIRARAAAAKREGPALSASLGTAPAGAARSAADSFSGPVSGQMGIVLEVLAEASGRPVKDLRPEMDLRYDLALRSSRFPLIIQEAEQRLGLSVNFEDLLQVSTIGDLARALTGTRADAQTGMKREAGTAAPAPGYARRRQRAPLCRFAPGASRARGAEGGDVPPGSPPLSSLSLDPCGQGLPLRRGDVLALCVFDPDLLPGLLSGLAPLGCTLALPGELLEICAPLAKAGSRLTSLALPAAGEDGKPDAESLRAALCRLAGEEGRVDGVFFAPAPGDAAAFSLLEDCLRPALNHGLRYACCFSRPPLTPETVEKALADGGPLAGRLAVLAREGGFACRAVVLLDDGQGTGPSELGDMLARELLRGDSERVIWARESVLYPGRAPRGPRLVERPEFFPLVFPDPQPPLRPTATLFQGACQFSRFADPALAVHGGGAGNALGTATPWLPVSRALQALLEGSRLLLPWLAVTGLSDVRFHESPLLPPGVTRECRLSVEARPWLMHDRVMTRMCRADLAVRELTENGRRMDHYSPVAEGMVLLAAASGEVPPLWPAAGPDDASRADAATDGDHDELAAFYDALGLSAPWRLLSGFAALPGGMYRAALAVPEAPIAPEGNWGYTDCLHMVEGIVQAASLALSRQRDNVAMAAELRRWRLNAAGFIRFGGERGARGPWRLQLRRSWADDKLLRFDAQISDARERVLLTLHHLEFDRLEPASPAE
ncbi:acyltransferase domain-containing protein [Desulfovibrio sp. PG-178-WT-4]|uniref:[acyl-carrier-protein] S-malonyltransferase n=1 Tax=Desulfovibrio porci TaxID=2605782 RepID=A0A6L5XIM1_9BACT|nr:acyltransferase domain-containing protein [Desulfovibrio porci]MDY3809328.1 acyltransferase domain-containing protein [Desulfovibrio porci]MSS27075.1 acyltransferase domain-containing protein [Desulfovibrio porci]